MTYIVVACFILNAGFLAIKLILWLENNYYSEQKENNTHTAQESPMTNREKVISDIVEQLPSLSNGELALVLFWCFYENIGCPHCGFHEDGKVCDKRSAACMSRLEDWLNQYDYA